MAESRIPRPSTKRYIPIRNPSITIRQAARNSRIPRPVPRRFTEVPIDPLAPRLSSRSAAVRRQILRDAEERALAAQQQQLLPQEQQPLSRPPQSIISAPPRRRQARQDFGDPTKMRSIVPLRQARPTVRPSSRRTSRPLALPLHWQRPSYARSTPSEHPNYMIPVYSPSARLDSRSAAVRRQLERVEREALEEEPRLAPQWESQEWAPPAPPPTPPRTPPQTLLPPSSSPPPLPPPLPSQMLLLGFYDAPRQPPGQTPDFPDLEMPPFQQPRSPVSSGMPRQTPDFADLEMPQFQQPRSPVSSGMPRQTADFPDLEMPPFQQPRSPMPVAVHTPFKQTLDFPDLEMPPLQQPRSPMPVAVHTPFKQTLDFPELALTPLQQQKTPMHTRFKQTPEMTPFQQPRTPRSAGHRPYRQMPHFPDVNTISFMQPRRTTPSAAQRRTPEKSNERERSSDDENWIYEQLASAYGDELKHAKIGQQLRDIRKEVAESTHDNEALYRMLESGAPMEVINRYLEKRYEEDEAQQRETEQFEKLEKMIADEADDIDLALAMSRFDLDKKASGQQITPFVDNGPGGRAQQEKERFKQSLRGVRKGIEAMPVPKEQEEPEEITPELISAMMFTDESGPGMANSPNDMFAFLFGNQPDEPSVAPMEEWSLVAQLQTDAVPPAPAEQREGSLVLKEEAVFPTTPTPPTPSGAQSPAQRTTVLPGSASPSLGETLLRKIEMEDQKRELPNRYNLIQLCGSTPPPWFRGFFEAFPHTGGRLRITKSPSRTLQTAWELTRPEHYKPHTMIRIPHKKN